MAENLEARVEGISDTTPQKQTKEYVPATGYVAQIDEDADGYLEDALKDIVQQKHVLNVKEEEILNDAWDQFVFEMDDFIPKNNGKKVKIERYRRLSTDIYSSIKKNMFVDFRKKILEQVSLINLKQQKKWQKINVEKLNDDFLLTIKNVVEKELEKLWWIERILLWKTITTDTKHYIVETVNWLLINIAYFCQDAVRSIVKERGYDVEASWSVNDYNQRTKIQAMMNEIF